MPTLINPSNQTITQYNVQTGAALNLLNEVAPSATSGIALVSQGASAQPVFGVVSPAGGGTGVATVTGLLTGNGTSPMTGTAITQYNVLTAGASNLPNSVAPSAASGIPLISQGSSSQPIFGTATVPGGGTGDVSFTAYSVICGGTTTTGAFQNVVNVGTSGQVLTSAGPSALPTWSTFSNTFTTVDVTGSTQAMAVQTRYLTDNAGGVTYTLPATASLGDTMKVSGKLGISTITPNSGQQIVIGSVAGTVGATGTCVSTNVGDCITLVAIVSGSNTVWRAETFVGNWAQT